MKILILLIALLACLFDDTSFASPSATAAWVATTTAINSSRSAAQEDDNDEAIAIVNPLTKPLKFVNIDGYLIPMPYRVALYDQPVKHRIKHEIDIMCRSYKDFQVPVEIEASGSNVQIYPTLIVVTEDEHGERWFLPRSLCTVIEDKDDRKRARKTLATPGIVKETKPLPKSHPDWYPSPYQFPISDGKAIRTSLGRGHRPVEFYCRSVQGFRPPVPIVTVQSEWEGRQGIYLVKQDSDGFAWVLPERLCIRK